jgi:phosphate binding protein
MSQLALWFCIVLLIGAVTAADVPFVFDETTSGVAGYTSYQLEQVSVSSPCLAGIPAVTQVAGSEVLDFPITGGGNLPNGTVEKKVSDLKIEFDARVEPENSRVNKAAIVLALKYPGDLTIDQIAAIYGYLKDGDDTKKGWGYVRDPRGIDYLRYANETLEIGAEANRVGGGDCDDFSILMAALVESVGGTTRIILASNSTTGGHAYTEVYLGQLNATGNQVETIIDWLKGKFNTEKIYTHIDSDTKDVWLNLDWGPDEEGNAHPGGPFFQGDKHIVLCIRDKFVKTPLKQPEPPKREADGIPTIRQAVSNEQTASKNSHEMTQVSPKGTVRMSGSTTVLPLGEAGVDAFKAEQNDYRMSVTGGGTSVGIKNVAEGNSDIGMASREVTADEISQFGDNFHENLIALDGIVVAVSRQIYNAGVTSLTKDQVKMIYNGEIRNWKDLGGPDKEILVVAIEQGSGTRDTFNEDIMGNNAAETPGVNTVVGGNAEAKNAILGSDKAIGYLGFTYSEDGAVGSIILDGIAPTADTIKDGSYELARKLYLYTFGDATPGAKAFIDFMMGEKGHDVAGVFGYVTPTAPEDHPPVLDSLVPDEVGLKEAGAIVTRTAKAGIVATGSATWNADTFAGFYYDIDDNIKTEELTTTVIDGNKLVEPDGVIYTTTTMADDFEFEDWGRYNVIGFMGEKYFAGYLGTIDNADDVLFEKSFDKNVLSKKQIFKILKDEDTEIAVSTGTPLQLEEGYKLAIKSIDIDSPRVYLELSKDGYVVDSKVISPSREGATMLNKTYYYRMDVGDCKDVVIVAVHFKNAFRGADQNLATVDGIWQLSDTSTNVREKTEYYKMTVQTVTDDTILMNNVDNNIILLKGREISLMPGISIKVSDEDEFSYTLSEENVADSW